MNKINFKLSLDDDGQPSGPHQVYVKLTPEADKPTSFGGAIRLAFEVPILQGQQKATEEGGTEYWFQVDDEQAELLRKTLIIAFFSPEAN